MPNRSASFQVVSNLVDGPPYRIQVAYDGNWMEAWRFGQEALPSSRDIEAAVAGRAADVAVEFCFRLLSGEEFFYGQRHVERSDGLGAVEFVERAVACGAGRNWATLQDFLTRLERAVINSRDRHDLSLCELVGDVEIGITDWWHRGDVIEVWNGSSAHIPSYDQLAEQIGRHPGLISNDINFVCLEFNFRLPTHHWFAIGISETRDGHHYINVPAAHGWLTRCLTGLADATG